MPFPIAAALAGGATLASSALNAMSDIKRNQTQLKLSRTAHQREINDLKAAGLNPILSATGGRGAPMADLVAPHVDGGGTLNSALSAQMNQAQLDSIRAQTQKTLAEADSAKTSAWLNDQTRWFNYHNAEASSALQLNSLYKSDVEVSSPVLKMYMKSLMDQYNQAHSAAAAARLSLPELEAQAKMYASPLGKYMPYIHSAREAAGRGIFR